MKTIPRNPLRGGGGEVMSKEDLNFGRCINLDSGWDIQIVVERPRWTCWVLAWLKEEYNSSTLSVYAQLTHNVFITWLESCAKLFWDKRCSNLVATFDQIYFVWQWKWVISNVATTLQQRYLATYNVAKINVIWQHFPRHSLKVATQCCGNVATTLNC